MTVDTPDDSQLWSALLVKDHLIQVADAMTAEMIMTPSAGWVSVKPVDTIVAAAEMMQDGFDQLPLVHESKPIGIVCRADVDGAADPSVSVGDIARGVSGIAMARTTDNFSTVCGTLSAMPFCFVFSPQSGEIEGLIHFADLNRQAVRTYCYLWLSALEMGLAECWLVTFLTTTTGFVTFRKCGR